MDFVPQLSLWFLRGFTIALFVVTVLPFAHTGWWVVRVCDFPRLQLTGLAIAAVIAGIATAASTPGTREPWFWAGIAAVIAAWQSSHVLPFTPLWPRPVADAASPNLSLVVANVDFRNADGDAALQALQAADADVYLLIEIDDAWRSTLDPLRSVRTHRAEHIAGDGLGLVVWSRHPLANTTVEFLVADDRPSIHATVVIDDRPLQLVALHPTPPGLPAGGDKGRHNSRIRDAELLLVADRVARDHSRRWIVAGDFNDVAWSRITRLFKSRSGLLDPRVGRGLINTYHTRYPPLRYPLDHVFVSKGFKVGAFARFRVKGSDHFAVRVDLEVPLATSSPSPNFNNALSERADEVIDEGREDAAETGGTP